MFRKFWNKYKTSLKKEILVHILVIIGLIGILCTALSSCLEQEQPESEPESPVTTEEQYRTDLQNQLAAMLCRMDGVGKAEVLVTLSGSEVSHYAQEENSRYVTVGGSQKEALLESVSVPAVTGVVVACEGGNKPAVQEIVYQTVAVACGLKLSQIYVTQLTIPKG